MDHFVLNFSHLNTESIQEQDEALTPSSPGDLALPGACFDRQKTSRLAHGPPPLPGASGKKEVI